MSTIKLHHINEPSEISAVKTAQKYRDISLEARSNNPSSYAVSYEDALKLPFETWLGKVRSPRFHLITYVFHASTNMKENKESEDSVFEPADGNWLTSLALHGPLPLSKFQIIQPADVPLVEKEDGLSLWFINDFYIRPEFRKHRNGESDDRMMLQVMRKFSPGSKGVRMRALVVSGSAKLIEWYRSQGYVHVGIVPRWKGALMAQSDNLKDNSGAEQSPDAAHMQEGNLSAVMERVIYWEVELASKL